MTLISLTFDPETEKMIMDGRKCCTIMDEPKGELGDFFLVRDRIYRIVQVDECNISWHHVYMHYFAYVCDVCFNSKHLCPLYKECREVQP